MSQPAQTAERPNAGATIDFSQIRQIAEWHQQSPLLSCRFDPSGKWIYAGAHDFSVLRFNAATGRTAALAGHDSWVRASACGSHPGRVYTGGYDGRLIFWDADDAQPKPVRTIDAHQGWIRAIAVSPDGRLVATAGNDLLVKIWNAEDGGLVQPLAGHQKHVYSLLFHPQGTSLAAGDLGGIVVDWELSSGEPLRRLDAAALWRYDPAWKVDVGGVRSMAFDPSGAVLACGGITEVTNPFAGIGHPLVLSFDWASGQLRARHTSKQKKHGAVSAVRWHPAGYWLAAVWGADGGFLLFWNPDQSDDRFEFRLPQLPVDADLHPDGSRLATAHHDGSVRIWRLPG